VIHPHPVPPYDAKAMRRAYEYGCGRGRVLRKHEYPLCERAKILGGPLKRAVACAANLKTAEARYHWNVLRGRSRGLVGKANVLPGPRR
jgi:hypothetical protein